MLCWTASHKAACQMQQLRFHTWFSRGKTMCSLASLSIVCSYVICGVTTCHTILGSTCLQVGVLQRTAASAQTALYLFSNVDSQLQSGAQLLLLPHQRNVSGCSRCASCAGCWRVDYPWHACHAMWPCNAVTNLENYCRKCHWLLVACQVSDLQVQGW